MKFTKPFQIAALSILILAGLWRVADAAFTAGLLVEATGASSTRTVTVSGDVSYAQGGAFTIANLAATKISGTAATLSGNNALTGVNTIAYNGGLRFKTNDGSATKAYSLNAYEFTEHDGNPCREFEIGYNIFQNHQLDATEPSCWWNYESHYDLYPSVGHYFETHLSFAPPGFNPGVTMTPWCHAMYTAWDRTNNRISRTFLSGRSVELYAADAYDGSAATATMSLTSTQGTFAVPLSVAYGLSNGICLSWGSATKPTVRPDGTALQSGDRWYKSLGGNTGQWFIWDGGYSVWVSEQRYSETVTIYADSGGLDHFYPIEPFQDTQYDLFITDVSASLDPTTTNNATNYWSINIERVAANGAHTNVGTVNTIAGSSGTWAVYKATINVLLDLSAIDAKALDISTAKTGSPGTLYGSARVNYRLAHP